MKLESRSRMRTMARNVQIGPQEAKYYKANRKHVYIINTWEKFRSVLQYLSYPYKVERFWVPDTLPADTCIPWSWKIHALIQAEKCMELSPIAINHALMQTCTRIGNIWVDSIVKVSYNEWQLTDHTDSLKLYWDSK